MSESLLRRIGETLQKRSLSNVKVRALSKKYEDFVHLRPEGHRAIKDSFHLSPGEPWEPADFFLRFFIFVDS